MWSPMGGKEKGIPSPCHAVKGPIGPPWCVVWCPRAGPVGAASLKGDLLDVPRRARPKQKPLVWKSSVASQTPCHRHSQPLSMIGNFGKQSLSFCVSGRIPAGNCRRCDKGAGQCSSRRKRQSTSEEELEWRVVWFEVGSLRLSAGILGKGWSGEKKNNGIDRPHWNYARCPEMPPEAMDQDEDLLHSMLRRLLVPRTWYRTPCRMAGLAGNRVPPGLPWLVPPKGEPFLFLSSIEKFNLTMMMGEREQWMGCEMEGTEENPSQPPARVSGSHSCAVDHRAPEASPAMGHVARSVQCRSQKIGYSPSDISTTRYFPPGMEIKGFGSRVPSPGGTKSAFRRLG